MKHLYARLLFLFLFVTPAHATVFRGVVLSPQGQPVPQAQLWIGPTRLFDYSQAKGTLRQMTTGADGRFEVEFPDAQCTSRLAYARVQSEAWRGAIFCWTPNWKIAFLWKHAKASAAI